MKETIDLLGKILTNILTALYEPFGFSLRLGTFQLSDIFYNTVGGALGGLLYYVAMKARKRL